MTTRTIWIVGTVALMVGCGSGEDGSGSTQAIGGTPGSGGWGASVPASGGNGDTPSTGGVAASGGLGGTTQPTTGGAGAPVAGGTGGTQASGGASGGVTTGGGGLQATGGTAGFLTGGMAETGGATGGVGGAAGGTGAVGGSQGGSGGDLSSDDPNVVAITVDSGPDGSFYVNGPFATITLCEPGTDNCQTIDHLLIDTGSTGIRVLESVVDLDLPAATSSSGMNLAQCLPFMSGSSWGPVRTADFKIGGETASNMRIQLIGELTYPMPSSCTGTPITGLDTLGSHGILGVGLTVEDCGEACASQGLSNPGLYYECASAQRGGCTTTAVPLDNQIGNPVASFDVDNNGSFLQFPSIAAAGAPQVDGFLVFGIGTRANNGLGSAQVIPTDGYGFITTAFPDGGTQYNSFIDSGSNGLYFLDPDRSSIPVCTWGEWTGFYCPETTTDLNATIVSMNGTTVPVDFTVANPSEFSSEHCAFSNLGGPLFGEGIDTLNIGFDWGFPFYLGRTVFTALEERQTPGGTGPYFAF